MQPDGTAHYVKPAGKTTTPGLVISVDTETRAIDRGSMRVEQLRVWDLRADYRRHRRRQGEVVQEAGSTAEELAETIDKVASTAESCWIYAHNVAFDMSVTRLPELLTGLGWELSPRFGLTRSGMWCVLHKGRRAKHRSPADIAAGRSRDGVSWLHTITIADSGSIFPAPLEELAQHTGMIKPPLPDGDDSEEAWHERCRADTEILARLLLDFMDWWETADLGHWSVTGPALAMQSYRRTLTPKQLVIDHNDEIVDFERAAVYGGRRDVFQVGSLPAGRYGEIDYIAAYPTIAAECPLPARMACPVTDQHRQLAMRGKVPLGMLAEVTITTDTPRWPCRVDGRVFYPVGTFRTVLASPDIQAAADAHALAAVHDGYLYTLSGHLRTWARWITRLARAAEGAVPGCVKVWAKAAGRYVIGKMAQKGWSTQPWVGEDTDGWSVTNTIGLSSGITGTITGLAGQFYLSWQDKRGEHERPAILAFVEAHVRVRLGRVITSRYGPAVKQCDTDGIMVSYVQLRQLAAVKGRKWRAGQQIPADISDVLEHWNELSYPLTMREKTIFRQATVIGPQHVVLDGKPRFAGVPKGAWQTTEGKYMARLWPGITWQSRNGPVDGYGRPLQEYTVIGPYAQGWALENGTVRPCEAAVDVTGGSYLLEWKATRWAASGDVLGPRQAIWAAGLWEET